uniref:PL48 domain-containing protein n=1 Tax=Parastrongyloides trichosuri TaxID=131310 RepID=A0A0N4ZSC9_PARTI
MSRLQVEIKKIIGFSRLCEGDKFEVIIKHASQVQKCKGKIQSNKIQMWDNSKFIMICYPKYNIDFKVKELKFFGSKTLTKVSISTTVFYKKSTKTIIFALNPSGTLKLELKISLNPSPDPNITFKNIKKPKHINVEEKITNFSNSFSLSFMKSNVLFKNSYRISEKSYHSDDDLEDSFIIFDKVFPNLSRRNSFCKNKLNDSILCGKKQNTKSDETYIRLCANDFDYERDLNSTTSDCDFAQTNYFLKMIS